MAAQDAASDKASVSEGARLSWFARQLALWSQAAEPLRPLSAPRARVTAQDASWPLTPELISVGRARRLAIEQVGAWRLDELPDTVELLVSELVTNALCHARGPVRLNLQVRDARLRCEVEDTNSDGPVRRSVCADAEGGRGMEILDLLAEAWGSSRTATGKTLWFELPVSVPAQTGGPGSL
ncbi:ATP-binding protein [Streptomyces sp. NBC_00624]|uniref:ATP-binding protein n=1 Tax=Streptomyces sp. NBC_00624 TaxID=2975791 RepID=UPI0030E0C492